LFSSLNSSPLSKLLYEIIFASAIDFFYTKAGDGLFDFTNGQRPDLTPGNVERVLNRIRRELDPDFGQRMIYCKPGYGYIPFDRPSYNNMLKGIAPKPSSRVLKIY
jgi:hypothetical protein